MDPQALLDLIGSNDTDVTTGRAGDVVVANSKGLDQFDLDLLGLDGPGSVETMQGGTGTAGTAGSSGDPAPASQGNPNAAEGVVSVAEKCLQRLRPQHARHLRRQHFLS